MIERLFKIEIFRDEIENGNVETEDKKTTSSGKMRY